MLFANMPIFIETDLFNRLPHTFADKEKKANSNNRVQAYSMLDS